MSRFKRHITRYFNNEYERHSFVIQQLQLIPSGSLILDAGAGSQRYRKNCDHLVYRAQDFASYEKDEKRQLGDRSSQSRGAYPYGPLDYRGNIWEIAEADQTFDAILCTEVLEHVPYPIETLAELSRLLKSGGTLILTAPSNCLRHFDPYFFTSGLSDRWFEKFCNDMNLSIVSLEPVGDYYRWIAVELYRTMKVTPWAALLLIPSLIFYVTRRPSIESVDTLTMGYHLVARKE